MLSCRLFKDIDERDLPDLLKCLNMKEKLYKKDELIYHAGDEAGDVGIVSNGVVQVIKEDIWGNKTILANLGIGDIFGEAFACAQTDKLPVSVSAVSDCRIMFIDYKKITTACTSACGFHSILIENMMRILAEKNVRLNQKIDILAKRTTKDKLIAYLSARAQEVGQTQFDIPFSRQELADYLCADRSALSKELGKLKKEGILDFHKSHFEFLK